MTGRPHMRAKKKQDAGEATHTRPAAQTSNTIGLAVYILFLLNVKGCGGVQPFHETEYNVHDWLE